MLTANKEFIDDPYEDLDLICMYEDCNGVAAPHFVIQKIIPESGDPFEKKFVQYHCNQCGLAAPRIQCHCSDIDPLDPDHWKCRRAAQGKFIKLRDTFDDAAEIAAKLEGFFTLSNFQNKLDRQAHHHQSEINDVRKRQHDVASGQIDGMRYQNRQVQQNFEHGLEKIEEVIDNRVIGKVIETIEDLLSKKISLNDLKRLKG